MKSCEKMEEKGTDEEEPSWRRRIKQKSPTNTADKQYFTFCFIYLELHVTRELLEDNAGREVIIQIYPINVLCV